MKADTAEIARRIADEFEADGIPYALGGALAYAYWGAPRGTLDVDLDLFGPPDVLERAFVSLRRAGVVVGEAEARVSVAERGDFRGVCGGIRVDVFVAFDPFHESVFARRVRVNLMDRPLWVLSAEDLTIFKVLFDRPKDWVDIERMIALQSTSFDLEYVRKWLSGWLEASDERLGRLEDIHRRFVGQ